MQFTAGGQKPQGQSEEAKLTRTQRRKLRKQLRKESDTQRRSMGDFWWNGGTLHLSRLSQYVEAPTANRWATMADFVFQAAKEEDYDPRMQFGNPNECLVNYVIPLDAELQIIARDFPHLGHWPTSGTVLMVMYNSGFIGRHVVAEEVAELQLEKLKEQLNNVNSPTP